MRALSACVITNAHFTGIYPTDLLANGGLLGDVLFFSISGYCLTNLKLPFFRWYGKRIYRIYIPVILISIVYVIIHYSHIELNDYVNIFIYPTIYHFIASIVVLYIPFYFCMKFNFIKLNLLWTMVVIGILFLLTYVFLYDKSYYHIDTVREPIIRFLFFESMLLGAYFRVNDDKYRNKYKKIYPFVAVILFIVYCISKYAFSHINSISNFQIVNQILLFILLFYLFKLFAGLDNKLENLNNKAKNFIGLLAKLTLEIYLVQIVILFYLQKINHFPINWIISVLSIFIGAYILNKLSSYVQLFFEKIIIKVKKK